MNKLDTKELLDNLKKLTEPQLKETADKIKADFKIAYKDYLEQKQMSKFDDAMNEIALLQIKSLMEKDPKIAAQYATAADRKMRSLSVLLVAEKVVADAAFAKLVEAGAIAVWRGFKELATSLVAVVVKGAISGALGPIGGIVTDAAANLIGKPKKAEEA